jgi:hypothetical protein
LDFALYRRTQVSKAPTVGNSRSSEKITSSKIFLDVFRNLSNLGPYINGSAPSNDRIIDLSRETRGPEGNKAELAQAAAYIASLIRPFIDP